MLKSKGPVFKLTELYNGTCKRQESFQFTVLFRAEESKKCINQKLHLLNLDL